MLYLNVLMEANEMKGTDIFILLWLGQRYREEQLKLS